MNKKDIKAAVSIEFGLSIERSGKVVDNIFDNIIEYFRKNKIVEIQKFGKFKIVTEKDPAKHKFVKFTPSKKLSQRVNSNFDNLKKVKVKPGKDDKSAIKAIGLEFKTRGLDNAENNVNSESDEIILHEKSSGSTINTGQLKLITEDLINLHKEIIKEEEKETNKNNLWG